MQSINRVWRQYGFNCRRNSAYTRPVFVHPVRFGSIDTSTGRLTEGSLRLRMILGIRWHDFIRNTEVSDTTNLPCIKDIITRRRNSLFGHMIRLDDHTPAHRALSQVAAIRMAPALPVGAGEQVAHATRGFNKSPTAHLLAFAPNGPGFAVVTVCQ